MKLHFMIDYGARATLPMAIILALAMAAPMEAQERPPLVPPLPPAIEDNSFLIEEAYNQEGGVVQHISTFMRFDAPQTLSDYSFTQEWPLGGPAHQLSLTLSYTWSHPTTGFGDALLNYRYQLLGHDDWAAVAPRLSLVVPASGGPDATPGIQLNLPASKRVGAHLVFHANAGATFLPGRGRRLVNLGASAIGLVTGRFNIMLEVLSTHGDAASAEGWVTIVNPGLRHAINLGGLQIVPGIALPTRLGNGRSHMGVFAYLSLEHPF